MGGRNLFRTDSHAIKNGLATPHALLGIYRLQNFFIPSVPRVNQKTISLGQHGRPPKFGVLFKSRAGSEADAAEDAVDVGIDLFTLLFFHHIFHLWRDGLSLEVRFNFAIVIKKSGHIDDEVSNHGKEEEGFDESRHSQQVFNMGSAGQDIFAVDPHGTGPTYSSPTGIPKRERLILFILNVQQRLQEIHSFPDLHLKGFDPQRRILLLMKPPYSQGEKIGLHWFSASNFRL